MPSSQGTFDSRGHCVIHHHVHPSRVYIVDRFLPLFYVAEVGIKKGQVNWLERGQKLRAFQGDKLRTNRICIRSPWQICKRRPGNVDSLSTD